MDDISFEHQLDAVLDQKIALIIERQKIVYEKLIDKYGKTFILFGAGRLGQTTLEGLRKSGIQPLVFSDNDPRLWNTFVEGLLVLSPQDAAAKYSTKAVFVITVYTSQPVREQLSSLGVTSISFAELAWNFPSTLLPHADLELPQKIFENKNLVRDAFALCADDASRHEFLGQLKWRTSLDPTILPPHLPQQEIYFLDDFVTFDPDEVFVDCGAYDGDTIHEFIRRHGSSFKQIIAIEPDPINCQLLKNNISSLPDEERKKISILQNAIGTQQKKVNFNAIGSVTSSVGGGAVNVECAPLDKLLKNFRPTFIKMDIEGAELDAISSANNLITKTTPVLAICLYHCQEHLWEIPLLIRSFSDRYKFYFRRYSDDCWELVCYAIPVNRLKV